MHEYTIRIKEMIILQREAIKTGESKISGEKLT